MGENVNVLPAYIQNIYICRVLLRALNWGVANCLYWSPKKIKFDLPTLIVTDRMFIQSPSSSLAMCANKCSEKEGGGGEEVAAQRKVDHRTFEISF